MERVRVHQSFLKTVALTKREEVGKELMKAAKPGDLDAVCEIILNVLRGNVPLTKAVLNKASQHKNILRKLAKKCLKKVIRKKLFIKYFTVIKKLLAAVLPIVGIVLTVIQMT